MSALDGFRTLWSHANDTFGHGTPSDGAQFDRSDRLQSLQDTVRAATPDGAWTGSASDSYAEANTKQEQTLGGIARLDKRLASEVDRSAAVVLAGRRDLANVRQWVNDAAARVPNTTVGERMLYPVISKGSSDIQDILTRSHRDMSAIAGRIRSLSGEYQALGEGEGGKAGEKLDKLPKTPDTTLDLDDIEYLDPNALGPVPLRRDRAWHLGARERLPRGRAEPTEGSAGLSGHRLPGPDPNAKGKSLAEGTRAWIRRVGPRSACPRLRPASTRGTGRLGDCGDPQPG